MISAEVLVAAVITWEGVRPAETMSVNSSWSVQPTVTPESVPNPIRTPASLSFFRLRA
jgi:hypothetical protein